MKKTEKKASRRTFIKNLLIILGFSMIPFKKHGIGSSGTLVACINRDKCLNACPSNAIFMDKEGVKINPAKCGHPCKDCLICFKQCPSDAITCCDMAIHF